MKKTEKGLNETMLTLQEKINSRARKSYLEKAGIDPDSNHVIQDLFPATLFKSTYRNIPNDFARSCLFTARSARVERKTFTREKLFHITESVEFLYTGQELRSLDDELIWLQLVDYCRSTPLGEYTEFDIRQLMNDVGWKTTGHYYKKVRESISRLKATEIYIKNNATFGTSGGISLINDYIGVNQGNQTEPTKYKISINKELIVLFAGGTFTNIPWGKYKSLTPMGRRLADYALSHKYPNPIRIQLFLQLCGSEQVDSNEHVKLKTARKVCLELMTKGVVKYAYVTDGKIVIDR